MDDASLWDAFSKQTLPAAAWTHEAHLRIAWMHLRSHAVDEAHVFMRAGIIRLNQSHGLVESPTRGYHETITRVWLLLVHGAMSRHDASDSVAFLAAAGGSLGVNATLRHYSKERLTGVAARARWIEPDLAPLPG